LTGLGGWQSQCHRQNQQAIFDEIDIATQTVRNVLFLAKYLSSKDEVKLLRDPVIVSPPLILNRLVKISEETILAVFSIHRGRAIVLLIDSDMTASVVVMVSLPANIGFFNELIMSNN
jgi:hypothetical protein